ncbi:unnamed protein product [Urochloa decumbens]|uniref:Uncharacterized protein n=1 Tax=Urochloa decumbens TaxID=240449 RepID=A0ABC8VWF2_9POAL
MAEISPAQRLGVSEDDEEMIMSLWDLVYDGGDVDQVLEADLLALRSMAAALLLDTAPLSPESWRWAEGAELAARAAAETMAEQAADIQRALSSLLPRLPVPAGFEEEAEAFLAALRRQAEYTAARRADAEEAAALARLVRGKEVRRMAEAAEPLLHPDAAAFLAATGTSEELALRRMAAAEHLVHPATAAFLGYIACETDALLARGEAMPADELALAPQVEDAAVRTGESMAALAGKLRRGAAEFAGVEELAAALHRQAANADAARATVEAFTASVRRFRAAAAASSAMPPAAPSVQNCRPF